LSNVRGVVTQPLTPLQLAVAKAVSLPPALATGASRSQLPPEHATLGGAVLSHFEKARVRVKPVAGNEIRGLMKQSKRSLASSNFVSVAMGLLETELVAFKFENNWDPCGGWWIGRIKKVQSRSSDGTASDETAGRVATAAVAFGQWKPMLLQLPENRCTIASDAPAGSWCMVVEDGFGPRSMGSRLAPPN